MDSIDWMDDADWKGKGLEVPGKRLEAMVDGRLWLPKREGTTKWEDLPSTTASSHRGTTALGGGPPKLTKKPAALRSRLPFIREGQGPRRVNLVSGLTMPEDLVHRILENLVS